MFKQQTPMNQPLVSRAILKIKTKKNIKWWINTQYTSFPIQWKYIFFKLSYNMHANHNVTILYLAIIYRPMTINWGLFQHYIVKIRMWYTNGPVPLSSLVAQCVMTGQWHLPGITLFTFSPSKGANLFTYLLQSRCLDNMKFQLQYHP